MDSSISNEKLKIGFANLKREHISSPLQRREDKPNVKDLIAKAKLFAASGDLCDSLQLFKQAYELDPKEKTLKRIQKIEDVMNESVHDFKDMKVKQEFNDEDQEKFVITSELSAKLYPHQITGINWMYSLYKNGLKGGILADDMGLGKTIQVIAFLEIMFSIEQIRHVLLVLPATIIPNWCKELKKWGPSLKVFCFTGNNISRRKKQLRLAKSNASVCITTYGLCCGHKDELSENLYGHIFKWDYIILDEGHKIKNPSRTTKSMHALPARNRIIMTGTPVQNKLRDLWALLDWTLEGSLLGTLTTFQSKYENPIENSRKKGSSMFQLRLGLKLSQSLKELTDPYILRRTKASVKLQSVGKLKHTEFVELGKKNDFVIWTFLSDTQYKIYKDFLSSDSVKSILTSFRSPLVYINILKKICDHPRLLSNRACVDLNLIKSSDIDGKSDLDQCAANQIDDVSSQDLLEESGKVQFLIKLLKSMKGTNHRTVVFSQSRKVLNIIQKILIEYQIKVMRVDGSIRDMQEREKRVQLFQNDPSYNVFLLTIQVGGVGLTLTGADRVVIFDPSWNPSVDNQAIDRIYRIGQQKEVIVYRLISCGTVEEKIYRRQVYKSSIIKQMVDKKKDPYRYFTKTELRDLFEISDPKSSKTHLQLQETHGHKYNWSDEVKHHIEDLGDLDIFGVSDNGLLFTEAADDFEEVEADNKLTQDILTAQRALEMESDQFAGNTLGRWGGGFATKSSKTKKNYQEKEIYKSENLETDDSHKVEIETSMDKSLSKSQDSFLDNGDIDKSTSKDSFINDAADESLNSTSVKDQSDAATQDNSCFHTAYGSFEMLKSLEVGDESSGDDITENSLIEVKRKKRKRFDLLSDSEDGSQIDDLELNSSNKPIKPSLSFADDVIDETILSDDLTSSYYVADSDEENNALAFLRDTIASSVNFSANQSKTSLANQSIDLQNNSLNYKSIELLSSDEEADQQSFDVFDSSKNENHLSDSDPDNLDLSLTN